MLFSLTLGLSFSLSLALASPIETFKFGDINTLISFGDSYTTRFINLTDLTYPCNCTKAGGPNWVVYLEDSTDWLSWDFAMSGAPVNKTLTHKVSSSPDVNEQMRDVYPSIFVSPNKAISNIMKSAYKDEARTSHSTLNTIWIGINDIGLTYGWPNTTKIDTEVMKEYATSIETLIHYGESQFLFMNVPPIERSPRWSNTTSSIETIKAHVKVYNEKLTKMVKELKSNFPQKTFLEYDTYAYFTKILDHPSDYGIKDITTYCANWTTPSLYNCNSLEEYFWIDNLHPTYPVHQAMAKDLELFLRNN